MKKFLALISGLLTFSAVAADVDKRQVLSLTEHQRDHVLTEMRAMLSGTQKILDALSREDMQTVASEARLLGMGMAKGEDHLKAILPKDFMQMGMSVHKSFDTIALDAESKRDPRHTLRQLSESMQKCNACHSGYQISVGGNGPASSQQPHQHHQH